MVASLLLGLGIAAAEVVSLGLIFPFIASLSGSGTGVADQTQLAFLVPLFEGLSTADKVRLIAVSLLGIQLFKGVLAYASGRLASYQKVLLDRDLRVELFDQLLDVELRYIHRERTANLYTILHTYANTVANTSKRVLTAVPKAATFVGYLVALFLLSWSLTLLALALALTTTWAIGFMTRIVRGMSRRINIHTVRMRHQSLEALNGIKVVHLFGRESYMRERFRAQLRTLQANKFRKSSVDASVGPIYQTLNTAMFAGVLVLGTFLLDTSAETWVVLLTMFMIVMFRLMAPAATYTKTRTKIAGDLPAFEQVIDFLARDDKPYLEDGPDPFPGLREAVRFEGLWFRYEPDEPDVLRGVDLTLPRGTTLALVGGSGAGKSTFVDLLARLYDPTRGRITVDGRDLRSFQVTTWRSKLAVVSQETFLFNDSVRENIRFGRLDASDAEVEEAARQANAHDFIEELPLRYDTQLGDRGVRLSGGQAQRLAIARAILADPEILILDEATSALDTTTERRVQEAIDRVSRDRTVVAIAHRLSTVRHADRIVVLDHGRLVEQGTHDELIAAGGAYASFVQLQRMGGEQTSIEPAPPAVPDRLVLREGPLATGEVRSNGGQPTVVRVRTVHDQEGADRLLARGNDDLAILVPGSSTAVVRLEGTLFDDVLIRLEREGPDGPVEVPVTVRSVRRKRASVAPVTADVAP